METQDVSKSDIKQQRRDEATRRKIMTRVVWIGIGVLILGALGFLIRLASRPGPGVFYPEVGSDHIALTDSLPKPYNSNPPSSGAHYPSPANWGVYEYEVNDRFFLHNLEHGGVWIAYRPSVATSTVDKLKAIVKEFDGSKIVMGPRSSNDADVALVSWTHVLKFNLVGGDMTEGQINEIRGFYKSYKNRGPEFVPDSMPGVDPKTVQ